jgi:hypothetical protein
MATSRLKKKRHVPRDAYNFELSERARSGLQSAVVLGCGQVYVAVMGSQDGKIVASTLFANEALILDAGKAGAASVSGAPTPSLKSAA